MLKIGQNQGKIANYPPKAQQRSAPLLPISILNLSCISMLLNSIYDQCLLLDFGKRAPQKSAIFQ